MRVAVRSVPFLKFECRRIARLALARVPSACYLSSTPWRRHFQWTSRWRFNPSCRSKLVPSILGPQTELLSPCCSSRHHHRRLHPLRHQRACSACHVEGGGASVDTQSLVPPWILQLDFRSAVAAADPWSVGVLMRSAYDCSCACVRPSLFCVSGNTVPARIRVSFASAIQYAATTHTQYIHVCFHLTCHAYTFQSSSAA